jgi:hypothetical protein
MGMQVREFWLLSTLFYYGRAVHVHAVHVWWGGVTGPGIL